MFSHPELLKIFISSIIKPMLSYPALIIWVEFSPVQLRAAQ
jgi:hypothetical protein